MLKTKEPAFPESVLSSGLGYVFRDAETKIAGLDAKQVLDFVWFVFGSELASSVFPAFVSSGADILDELVERCKGTACESALLCFRRTADPATKRARVSDTDAEDSRKVVCSDGQVVTMDGFLVHGTVVAAHEGTCENADTFPLDLTAENLAAAAMIPFAADWFAVDDLFVALEAANYIYTDPATWIEPSAKAIRSALMSAPGNRWFTCVAPHSRSSFLSTRSATVRHTHRCVSCRSLSEDVKSALVSTVIMPSGVLCDEALAMVPVDDLRLLVACVRTVNVVLETGSNKRDVKRTVNGFPALKLLKGHESAGTTQEDVTLMVMGRATDRPDASLVFCLNDVPSFCTDLVLNCVVIRRAGRDVHSSSAQGYRLRKVTMRTCVFHDQVDWGVEQINRVVTFDEFLRLGSHVAGDEGAEVAGPSGAGSPLQLDTESEED